MSRDPYNFTRVRRRLIHQLVKQKGKADPSKPPEFFRQIIWICTYMRIGLLYFMKLIDTLRTLQTAMSIEMHFPGCTVGKIVSRKQYCRHYKNDILIVFSNTLFEIVCFGHF